jgi:hypothetical protein
MKGIENASAERRVSYELNTGARVHEDYDTLLHAGVGEPDCRSQCGLS